MVVASRRRISAQMTCLGPFPTQMTCLGPFPTAQGVSCRNDSNDVIWDVKWNDMTCVAQLRRAVR